MNKAKEIRTYKEANPTHKPKDIAKACGVTAAYVYQVLNKGKNKVKRLPKQTPTDGQKIVRNEVSRLNMEVDGWRDLYLSCLNEMEQLHQDIIGYRAVISYLQGQIDGASV